MNYKLFTANVSSGNENVVNIPGFSHWGQPFPYGERILRKIYFFAKNRRQAAKHIEQFAGINYPCDLSEGSHCPGLLASGIVSSLEKIK